MKKAIGMAAIILAPLTFGLAQACPSDISLRPLPPLLCAPPPGTKISPMGWQAGASVTVYRIYNTNGTFSAAQKAAIEAAYRNWSNREGANLTFTFLDVPMLPSNPQYPYSQWDFADDPDCPSNEACTHTGWCSAGSTPAGFTTVTITNVMPNYSEAGYQLFTHEVGHTFGIEDCTTDDCTVCTGGNCTNAVTVMNPTYADDSNSPMSPHCCDSKLMYTMNGGAYGRPAGSCSPILVQQGNPAVLQGAAGQGNMTVSVTFPAIPQSGDTIVAGCLANTTENPTFSVTDNQPNTYTPVISTYVNADDALVGLFTAPQIASSQSEQFTVACSFSLHVLNPLDLFALEYADMGGPQAMLVDDRNFNGNGFGISPLSCDNVTTTAVNDLFVSIYNNETNSNEAGIAPTTGTIPYCIGGYNSTCVFQNAYEVGGLSTYTTGNPGTYSESWTGPIFPMSCAEMALKVIGP